MRPAALCASVYDALLEGTSGRYPSDTKLLYIVGCSMLNQFLNINKGVAALQAPEFTVIHKLFLTPTAAMPTSSSPSPQPWSVLVLASLGGPCFIHMDRAIEPLPDTKSDLDIFTELASRPGLTGYNNKSDEEWLREFVTATPDLPDYETFKREGVHHIPIDRPWVAFRKQVEDPARHPFPAPSGKIQIYSRTLAGRNDPLLPPSPGTLRRGKVRATPRGTGIPSNWSVRTRGRGSTPRCSISLA